MKELELGICCASIMVSAMALDEKGCPIETITDEINEIFYKQKTCDWGEVCEDDRESNNLAVAETTRVLGAHTLKSGVRVWIITEADRSSTMILLPEEY